jgi:hypothetical protein
MPKVNLQSLSIGDMSPDFLDSVSVSVEYSASQPAVSGSIGFSLIFENISADDIEILNPYDVMTYTLVDEAGSPVNLHPPASRIAAQVASAFVSQKEEYLRITKVVSGGSEKSIEQAVRLDRIILPRKSSYIYALQIDKMIPHSKQAQTSDQTTVKTNLTAGKYGIALTFPLISFVGNKEHSRILQSPNIEVSLG